MGPTLIMTGVPRGGGGHDAARRAGLAGTPAAALSDMVGTSVHQRPPPRLCRPGLQPEKPVTRPKGNTVPLT
jgi:hypothetical protein